MLEEERIKVICKRCGKESLAKDFTLDPVYKIVACPACVKERRENEKKASSILAKSQAENQSAAVSPKPSVGSKPWMADRIDINKAEPSADPNRIKHTCHRCKYRFFYNKVKKYPNLCPHCGAVILDM
jgi:DNA-directed RNA polymerase subunit RPC12/RpoP